MMKSICLLSAVVSTLTLNGSENPYPPRFEGMFQEYEGHPLDLISHFVPNDPVIFEAGGHYGEDTIRFTEKWPLSKVISFEPNPAAFKKLQDATRGLQRVQAHNLAVNNYNGTATLHICYGSTGDNPVFEGASSLLEASSQMAIHYQGPTVEVPCVILDNWCTKNNIDHIDFMWLDLEGLELQVLKASPLILATVKVIYTETNMYNFRKGMTQYKKLRPFLEAAGFTMLSHWYAEGFQGNAIFVKKELCNLNLPTSLDQHLKKN